MALNAGNASASAGLAKRIYDNIIGDASSGVSNPLGTSQAAAFKAFCYDIAKAVVDEIQANATVLIKSTDGALQRDADGLNPDTLAPLATKTLPAGAVQ